MVDRPIKVQIPFALMMLFFASRAMSAQDAGPWVVAVVVFFFLGGMKAVSLWPVAYRTPLIQIIGQLLLMAAGAFAAAILAALVTTGNLDGLFTAKERQVAPRTISTSLL